MGASPSAVSKSVARLEGRLGARLLLRTTRSLSLTPEGNAFYERASKIIRDIEEAEAVTQGVLPPRGLLRISVPLDLGRILIAQWSAEFLAEYPDLRLELQLTDRLVDLARDAIDVAVRLGELDDSTLITTKIGQSPFVTCAAPAYFEEHGIPATPADLSAHQCLRYITGGRPLEWYFECGGDMTAVRVNGRFDSDDGGALVSAACAGAGIAYLFRFQAEPHIESGRLRRVLQDYSTPTLAINALHASSQHVPPRVRVLIEFLRKRLHLAGYG